MKKIILLSLTLLCTTVWAQSNKTSIAGKISDSSSDEELIAANVAIYKGEILVDGTVTDFEGNYSLLLDPGTYDLVASYVGFAAKRVNGIVVRAGRENKLDVKLEVGGINLEEIAVVDYKIPIIEQDNTTQGRIVTSEDIRKFASKNVQSIAAASAGVSQSSQGDGCTVRGSRSNATDVYVDGIRVRASSAQEAPVANSNNNITTKTEKGPNAGQLTAGEWKDLDNWSFWDNLMKDQQFEGHRKKWGFYPNHRYELKLSDFHGQPLSHIKVNLRNEKQEIVWSAISDNKGSICAWGNFYGGSSERFEFEILHPDSTKKIAAIPYSKGLNNVQMASICSASKKVDIAFVVDVSGSMHDEIRYLRSEINDVVERASSDETELQVRTGAVFYSGRHEKQFLNSSPLTKGSETTAAFLRESPLGGGSSEAVNLGLGIAVREFDWNESAMARLVFVLLDEAPSHDEETKKDLHKLVQEAALKGIKVIPVAASGTNKTLEFLLKFMAMGTNSTYTFLTNHSGIGDNHIAPEAGSYNVETLNDLLVRLIIENAEYQDCETEIAAISKKLITKKEYRKVRRSKTNKKLTKQVRLSPNPASDYVNIDLEKAVDLLTITTMEGKVIAQYPQLAAGQIRLQTSDWQAGMYLIHFRTKEGYGVLKLVVTEAI